MEKLKALLKEGWKNYCEYCVLSYRQYFKD